MGFAFQLFPRTVIRSGYGLFWIPAAITEVTGDNRAPAWAINTLAVASLDGGVTPYNTLDNPYPDGILDPPGNKAGLNTLIGQNAAANQRNFRYRLHAAMELRYPAGTGSRHGAGGAVRRQLRSRSAGAMGEPAEPAD